jgi:hypothetical protein
MRGTVSARLFDMSVVFDRPVCPICKTVVEWGANVCVQHGDVMHSRCCAFGADRARAAAPLVARDRAPRRPQSSTSPRPRRAA